MSDDFEFGGENQMEFGTTSALVTRDLSNMHCIAISRQAFVIKKYTF